MQDNSEKLIKPDILETQHKQRKRTTHLSVLEEGQQSCLCCNKSVCCCPPSGSHSAEDMALQYLASVLVKISLASMENDFKNKK